MAASLSTPGRHGHRAAAPPVDSPTATLPPLAGQCLCGDFTIVISNPRPGMIMCHCYHCQINSASFFGTYITTGMSMTPLTLTLPDLWVPYSIGFEHKLSKYGSRITEEYDNYTVSEISETQTRDAGVRRTADRCPSQVPKDILSGLWDYVVR